MHAYAYRMHAMPTFYGRYILQPGYPDMDIIVSECRDDRIS